jgi:plastocyanin
VTAVDGSFDSGDLDPSQGFSWFFDQPGTYQYTCVQHPWMSGTIIVAEDGSAAESG